MLNRPLALVVGMILLLVVVWMRQPHPQTEVARTALIMGTLVEIKGVGPDKDQLEKAISEAFSAMRVEEDRFSPGIATSPVFLINHTLEPVEVGPQFLELFALGQRISAETRGAFHMGLGGLIKLWDLGSVSPRVPSEAEIKQVLPASTDTLTVINTNRVRRLSPAVQLDLGGIAKGFAVDRALEVLASAGLESASINAGGDIGLLGGHGERPWRIGIQHPREAGELLATIDLKGEAIVTSGDYERAFMLNGVRYHHIFDPQTGYPARNCQSVSVVAQSVAEADALATAAFVLGPEEGLRMLEEVSGVEGLIVAADGTIETTSGLKDQIQWQ